MMDELLKRYQEIREERQKAFDRLMELRMTENEATDLWNSEQTLIDEILASKLELEEKLAECEKRVKRAEKAGDAAQSPPVADPATPAGATAEAAARAEKYPLPQATRDRIWDQQKATMISLGAVGPAASPARTMTNGEFAIALKEFKSLFADKRDRKRMFRGLIVQHQLGEVAFSKDQLRELEQYT